MGGKKEIYRDVRFFHGAIQLYQLFGRIRIQIVPQINEHVVLLTSINVMHCWR